MTKLNSGLTKDSVLNPKLALVGNPPPPAKEGLNLAKIGSLNLLHGSRPCDGVKQKTVSTVIGLPPLLPPQLKPGLS